jgi:hypothetical protein
MVRNLRADLEAALPPDRLLIVWEQGQTLSLAETVERLVAKLEGGSKTA